MPYISYTNASKWKLRKVRCTCGTRFTTRDPNRLYCSAKCNKTASNKRRTTPKRKSHE